MVKDKEFVESFKTTMLELDDGFNPIYSIFKQNIAMMGMDNERIPKINITYSNKIFEILRLLNEHNIQMHSSLIGASVETYLSEVTNQGLEAFANAIDLSNSLIIRGQNGNIIRNLICIYYRLLYRINSEKQITLFKRKDVENIEELLEYYRQIDNFIFRFDLKENAISILSCVILLNENNWDKMPVTMKKIEEELTQLGYEDLIPALKEEAMNVLGDYMYIDFDANTFVLKPVEEIKDKVVEQAKQMHLIKLSK